MRVVKQLGLVLVAAIAFSAMAVSSASAAPKFLSHPAGKLLLASAGSTQTFSTGIGAVTCTALKLLPPDATPALEFLSILVVVDYEKCKIANLFTGVVHPVRYLIDANGLVKIENDVLILGPEGCVITVPAAKNQGLNTVAFENTPANSGVLLLASVKHITASGVGGPLGGACSLKEESEGTYEGTIHVTVDGGTLRWDPS